MGITFLWIGFLIIKNPEGWVSFINPWVVSLLPISPRDLLLGTGFFDIVVGLLLLINYQVKIASFLAALHLFLILLVSGINAVTVRNIGLLAGAAALFFNVFPEKSLGKSIRAVQI